MNKQINMFRIFLFLTAFYLFSPKANTQVTSIDIELENYPSDTLLMGYYLADKILVLDSLYADRPGHFKYERDSLLDPGLYIIVSVPQGSFYQFIVEPVDQTFTIHADVRRENSIEIKGSLDNELFNDYMLFLAERRAVIERLDNAIATTDSAMVSIKEQLVKDRKELNDEVAERQREIIEEHPESITAVLIKSNLNFIFPEFTGTEEEINNQKYIYYKEHYFDHIDLAHPSMLRTPIIHERVNYYMESLTPREPDSIIQSVDYLLGLMEPQEETFQYYLSYFLNHYANSKYIGMDAVYVHLALNYYGKGKAPWVPEENLKEIVDNAKKLEPVLIGKPAPDFTIQKEDGTPISLGDLTTDYVVLVFWRPECGHCTKAMPHVVEFQEKWKEKVQVLTICTRTGKEYGTCWEDVKKKDMGNLINAGDQYHRSRILSLYNATSTPLVYILDKDRKIKLRKVPAENLDPIMEELMKIDASQQ